MHGDVSRVPGPAPGHTALRIVLAEDHATMRRSLRLLLDGEPDIQVVAESGDLSTAMRQVATLDPDVLVLDLIMPSGSSFELLQRLRDEPRRTRTVVITMHDEPAFARYAHRAGALGFVLKDTADAELPEAVRRAARGQMYTSPRVAPQAMPLKV